MVDYKKAAEELAFQVYYALKDTNKPIPEMTLKLAVRKALGISTALTLKQIPAYSRFRIQNLYDVLVQDEFFIPSVSDGINYATLNMAKIERIKEQRKAEFDLRENLKNEKTESVKDGN